MRFCGLLYDLHFISAQFCWCNCPYDFQCVFHEILFYCVKFDYVMYNYIFKPWLFAHFWADMDNLESVWPDFWVIQMGPIESSHLKDASVATMSFKHFHTDFKIMCTYIYIYDMS